MAFYSLFHCGFISRFTDLLTATGIKLKSCLSWVIRVLNYNGVIIKVINTLATHILNFAT